MNKIGWNNHKFFHLVRSDHIQLALYGADDVRRLEFRLDYINESAGAPGGYESLGVTGGDGAMLFGSAANIVSADSSLATNFRNGMVLTVNSPATDASYTPNPAYLGWIFEVWYEVTFSPDVFGEDGFGYPRMTGLHSSPSKTGRESEVCVYEEGPLPPAAQDDSYTGKKNKLLTVPLPGVLANDFAGSNGGALTAQLVTTTSFGTLVLNANGSFTYDPNPGYRGTDTFTYKAWNGTDFTNVATVKIQVKN